MGATSLDAVARLEGWLAGGNLPTATLQRVLYDSGNARWHDVVLTAVYLSFFVVPHAVAVVLSRRDRVRFGRYLLATVAVFAFGLVGFFLAPTNPPWMTGVAADGQGGTVRRIVPEVLARLGVLVDPGSHGGGQPGGYGFEPNPVASMPSVHIAVTALLVFVAWRSGSVWRGAAVVYTGAMAFALVYLGEHYVADMAGGIVTAAVGWFVTRSFARRVEAERA